MSMSAAHAPATAAVPEVPYVPDAALPARSAPGLLLAGLVALVIAAWGGIVPYVGPTFGYGATGTGAWTWNYSHLVLGLAPGAAGVLGALMLLPGARRLPFGAGRSVTIAGGLLAVLAGAWFVIGPLTWPVWTDRAGYFVPAPPLRTFDDVIGYSLGTGAILVACGAFAVGQAVIRRTVPLVDPAGFPLAPRHLRAVPLGQPEPGPAAPVAGAAGPEVATPPLSGTEGTVPGGVTPTGTVPATGTLPPPPPEP